MPDLTGRPDAPILLVTKLHPPVVPAQTVARERLFERLRDGAGRGLTPRRRARPGSASRRCWRRGASASRAPAGRVGDAGRGRRRPGRAVVARHRGARPACPGCRRELPWRRRRAAARGRAAAAGQRARRAGRAGARARRLPPAVERAARESVAWFVDHCPRRCSSCSPPASIRRCRSARCAPAGSCWSCAPTSCASRSRRRRSSSTSGSGWSSRRPTSSCSSRAPRAGPRASTSRRSRSPASATSTRSSARSTARARTSSTSSPARCWPPSSRSCRRSCCAPRCSSGCARSSATPCSASRARRRRSSRSRARTSSCSRSTTGAAGSASTTCSPSSCGSSSSGASRRARAGAAPPRASAWHRALGTTDEAIHHALAAGAFDEAGALIAETWVHYANAGRTASVLDWLHRLPAAVLDGDPRLLLVRAWVAALRGSEDDMRAALARVRALGGLDDGPLPDGFASLESSLAVLSATFALGRRRGDPRARARARRQLEGPDRPGGR